MRVATSHTQSRRTPRLIGPPVRERRRQSARSPRFIGPPVRRPPVRQPPVRRGLGASGPTLGDVDGDGIVTEDDAQLILGHASGNIELTDEQLARADVSGDGEVSAYDAALVLRYVEGQIDTFPAGDPAPLTAPAGGDAMTRQVAGMPTWAWLGLAAAAGVAVYNLS